MSRGEQEKSPLSRKDRGEAGFFSYFLHCNHLYGIGMVGYGARKTGSEYK
jgi:hypothetical protein